MDFYDNSKVLSFDKNIMIVLGNRSAGKSFCWKEWAVKRFLNGKGQFIYMRRYDNELDKVSTFFDDIAFKFPDIEFKVKGRTFYINDELAGYAVPLSMSYKLKSVSFVDITFIMFDEFLPENGRYLRDEFAKLQGFYQTVARGGGKAIRNDVYMSLIANHVSYINPYFQAMNVRIRGDEKYIRLNKFDTVIEIFSNEGIANEIKESKVGGFLTLGRYGDYAQEGLFLLDDNKFIEPLPKNSTYKLTIKYDGVEYGVYLRDDRSLHIGRPDENFKIKFVFSNKDMSLNYRLISSWRTSTTMILMRECYEDGMLFFTSQSAKAMFLDIMKYSE